MYSSRAQRGGKAKVIVAAGRTPAKIDPTARVNKTRTLSLVQSTESRKLTVRQMECKLSNYRDAVDQLPDLQHMLIGIRLLSHDEVIKMGTMEIKKSIVNEDKYETVDDPSLGSTNPQSQCSCPSNDCAGHYGYIKFKRPVLHPSYSSNNNATILKLMKCICPATDCFKMLLSVEDAYKKGIFKMAPQARLDKVMELSKSLTCSGVEKINKNTGEVTRHICPKPKYLSSESKGTGVITYTFKSLKSKNAVERRTLNAKDVLTAFSSLTDEQAKMIGYEDRTVAPRLIMQSMLVTPPSTRIPENLSGGTKPSEFTKLLDKIVVANINLGIAMDNKAANYKQTESIPDAEKHLYDAISKYTKETSDVTQSKSGNIRGRGSSKRGNFCGRAVITPEDGMEVGQIMIPSQMASSIITEVKVLPDNIDYLQDLVKKGFVNTIKAISGPSSGMIKLCKPESILQNGDIVERWLQNGDWVIVLRPPNLHRQNIYAGRVILSDKRYTIGIPLAVTEGLHGDFDGDELIVIAVNGNKERTEAIELMDIQRNTIYSVNPRPIIAPLFDSIIASFLLTLDSTVVPSYMIGQAKAILLNRDQLDSYDARIKAYGLNPLSGKALFSIVLPHNFTYIKKGDDNIEKNPYKTTIAIVNGILRRGNIRSDHISSKTDSIGHRIEIQYGWQVYANYITDVVRIMRMFLDQHGFTIGWKDCTYASNPELRYKIQSAVNMAEHEAKMINENDPEYESKISEIISRASSVNKNVINYIDKKNNNIYLASGEGSGAKGSLLNMSYIAGIPVQLSSCGERLKNTLADGKRSKSHNRQLTSSLSEGGFHSDGYGNKGLGVDQAFDNFSSTREQIATKIVTSVTGTIQRNLGKTLEDLITRDSGTVVIGNFILQNLYGGSGMDVTKLVPIGDNNLSFVNIANLFISYNVEKGWIPKLADVDMSTKEYSKLTYDIEYNKKLLRDWVYDVVYRFKVNLYPPKINEQLLSDSIELSQYNDDIIFWDNNLKRELKDQNPEDLVYFMREFIAEYPYPKYYKARMTAVENGLIETENILSDSVPLDTYEYIINGDVSGFNDELNEEEEMLKDIDVKSYDN